jgi:hypothetical protein
LLQAVGESGLVRVVGQGALDTLAAVRECVGSMARGDPPGTRWMTSSFFQKIRPQLDLFMSHPKPKADSSGQTVYWFGKQAALKKFACVMALEKPSFEDLAPLHVFRHLLDEGQALKVEEKTKALLAGVTGGVASTSGAASSSKAGGKKAGKQADSSEAPPIADIMVLFS